MGKPSIARRTFLSTFAAAGILAPAKVMARRRDDGAEAGRLHGRLRDLELSPEQTSQVQAIRERHQPLIDHTRQLATNLRERLRSAFVEQHSEQQLRAINDQLGMQLNELRELRFKRALETYRALSGQQRRQLAGLDVEEQES